MKHAKDCTTGYSPEQPFHATVSRIKLALQALKSQALSDASAIALIHKGKKVMRKYSSKYDCHLLERKKELRFLNRSNLD